MQVQSLKYPYLRFYVNITVKKIFKKVVSQKPLQTILYDYKFSKAQGRTTENVYNVNIFASLH